MSAFDFNSLKEHIGHRIVCTFYSPTKKKADAQNVAVECVRCNEVLLDYDKPAPEPITLSLAIYRFFGAEINNKHTYNQRDPATLQDAVSSFVQMPTDVLREITKLGTKREQIETELASLTQQFGAGAALTDIIKRAKR